MYACICKSSTMWAKNENKSLLQLLNCSKLEGHCPLNFAMTEKVGMYKDNHVALIFQLCISTIAIYAYVLNHYMFTDSRILYKLLNPMIILSCHYIAMYIVILAAVL